MPTRYEERSGQLTALNTAVKLSTRFDTTSNPDYQASSGQKLLGFRFAVAADGAVVGAATFKVKFSGGAMPEDVVATVGAVGGTLATTGIAQAASGEHIFKEGFALKDGTLEIRGNMSEVDIGSAAMSITAIIGL